MGGHLYIFFFIFLDSLFPFNSILVFSFSCLKKVFFSFFFSLFPPPPQARSADNGGGKTGAEGKVQERVYGRQPKRVLGEASARYVVRHAHQRPCAQSKQGIFAVQNKKMKRQRQPKSEVEIIIYVLKIRRFQAQLAHCNSNPK